jgi:membrane fusion protein (multidrug efflux system)
MLASAEQDLKTERDELNRIEKLVETGAIPKDQLQLAKAKYYRMMAQAEKMKESSGDFEIVAPWRGIVSKVLVTDGNYVAARNVLLEMFDPESLVIRVAVPEAKSQEISPEMSVTVKLDAYNGHVFSGKVARIFPELDRRMRTRLVEVEPRENVKLIPGMFARVSLKLKSEKDATVVPTEAITVTPNGARIAYVVEDDKAVQRRVQVGLEGEGKVQILSGLSQGENVITAGNEKLKDGIEIRVQTEKKQGDKSKPKINAERREDGKK